VKYHLPKILSCEEDRKTSREAIESTLARKAAIEGGGARTANRHR
jgi:hypothetical protein